MKKALNDFVFFVFYLISKEKFAWIFAKFFEHS